MATQPLLIAGDWRPASELLASFRAEDPATGNAIGAEFPVNGAADVEAAITAAAAAADELARTPAERIATFHAYAGGIEHDAETLVALAHAETALPAETRLAKVE